MSLALKHMHMHVVRGFYRLFWPAYDGTWEAEAHFKLAVLKLEEARLDGDFRPQVVHSKPCIDAKSLLDDSNATCQDARVTATPR
jgi:hypothetical protein